MQGIVSVSVSVSVLLLFTLIASGCTELAEHSPALAGTTTNAFVHSASCQEYAERPCSVTLNIENDVATCLRGKQFFQGGIWTDCSGEGVTKQPFYRHANEGPKPEVQALGSSSTCSDPSDPFFTANCEIMFQPFAG